MTRAVLRLDLEGAADITRALGQIKGVVRSAQAGMNAEARRGASERTRIATAEGRAVAAAAKASEQARAVSERAASRAVATEARKREQSAKASAKERERAEREVTKTTEAEAKKRVKAEGAWAREVDTIHRRLAAARERAERQTTRATEREANRRVAVERNAARAEAQARRQGGAVVGQVGGAVVQGAGQFASGAHAQIQGARVTRAALQSQVMAAVSQVGVTDIAEINRLTDRVMEQSELHGVTPQIIAGAIGAAQTEMSALGPMNAGNEGARRAIFDRAIGTAVQGRNLGADPGEFSRLMGMLQQRGLSAGDQEQLARWTVGAEQAGAVSQGSITREAMGPMQQRMAAASAALAPTVTPDERSAAMASAYRQAFAEMQVLKSAGESVRSSGMSMANFNRSLSNTGDIAKMRTNVAHIGDRAQRERLQAALFNRQGGLNEGLSNPLAFVAAAHSAGMTDPTALGNLFAGTGAGNARSLTAPIRRMVMALDSADANGRTGFQNVAAMKSVDTALTPQRVAALAQMHEHSDEANLAREAVARERATGAPGWMQRQSNRVADFTSHNPMATLGLQTVGTSVLAVVGRQFAPILGRAALAFMGTGAGIISGAVGLSSAVGLGLGEVVNRIAYNKRDRAQSTSDGDTSLLSLNTWKGAGQGVIDAFTGGIGGGGRGHVTPMTQEELSRRRDARLASGQYPTAEAIGAAVARALHESPITVDPHTAVHVATVAASGRNPAPPASR